MNRREWIMGSALLPAVGGEVSAGPPKNIVISSSNGLRACTRAMEYLRAGKDTLDAVVSGVNINEEDPEDSTVGYGGLPNEEGVVELDASVMHGPTRRCGSVGALRNIKTASRVAKAVMEQSDHIMLVGDGALRFARACGFEEHDLLTEKSRLAWMVWKQSLRDPTGHSNWGPGLGAPPKKAGAWLRERFPKADEETLAWAWRVAMRPPTGTINCMALNSRGEMSGVTTTSGLAWKIPGRVGDSPLLGAGLWIDQDVGGGGSTGRGEENIRVAGAHTVVENMRHGMSAREACLDALKRVVRNFNGDRSLLAQFDLNFYALRKDGDYASACLWNVVQQRGAWVSRQFAVNDGATSRLETCAYLLERKP
ncbi:MAG TPA: N(4)-(beta-N-acetylglucosaminyl)-L-asparaginase [Bryobacteraceae bacterium]